jgi:hypothetical protein
MWESLDLLKEDLLYVLATSHLDLLDIGRQPP